MPTIRMNVTYRPRTGSGQFIEATITPGAKAAVQAVCNVILQRSQALVPVDTGELKASGTVEISFEGRTVVGRVVYTANHAAYVEFGTGIAGASSPGAGAGPYNPDWPGMPAQPYLRPAREETRADALEMFKSQLSFGGVSGRA